MTGFGTKPPPNIWALGKNVTHLNWCMLNLLTSAQLKLYMDLERLLNNCVYMLNNMQTQMHIHTQIHMQLIALLIVTVSCTFVSVPIEPGMLCMPI